MPMIAQGAGRFWSYLNTAETLIKSYDGSTPLVHHLKQYFTQHKKHGSKDRKNISHLCYSYFRLGKALPEISIPEKIKAALFLCQQTAGQWHSVFDDRWINNWNEPLSDRIHFLQQQYPDFNSKQIFNWIDDLSDGVDAIAFCESHLIQPDLFIRVRPGKQQKVVQQLHKVGIAFRTISDQCFAFEQTTKLDDVLRIDEDVVVQDVSSQRVGQYLTTIKNQLAQNTSSKPLNVWDSCAASGGKSILAKDTLPAFNLTVTDIRASILQNLKQRFAKASIQQYKIAAADLTGTNELPNDTFQLIICDAPCSGSGTWGRTPEQLYYFTYEKIDYYASLQQRIVTNASTRLAKGGYFLYITCSVFKAENENMVAFITQSLKLEHLQSGLISGYAEKGDTMFAALFIA